MPVIFLFFVIFIIIAIVVSSQQAQKTRESWSKAAAQLGLRFEAGGTFSHPAIAGSLGGCNVRVTTETRRSGKNSRRYTTFQIRYPQPIGLGLRLTQEGFFSGVARFLGAQDIEVGDAGFDADVVVKGANAREVSQFLTPARRARIQRLFSTHPGAVVDDRKVYWEKRGVVRDPTPLIGTVKALLRVARSLSAERAEDRTFERAMEAQHEGRIEEALSILGKRTRRKRRSRRRPSRERVESPEAPPHEEPVSPIEAAASLTVPDAHETPHDEHAAPVSEPEEIELEPMDKDAGDFHDEPVEERLLEAELLHLGGRHAEAKEAFEEVAKEAPDDPELRKWAEHVARQEQKREPAAAGPDVARGEALDVKSVCDALFSAKQSSFDAKRIFDERFAGKRIEWRGTLRSAEAYTYDLVLGSQAGTKASFEVYDLPEALFGEKKVLAITGLAPNAMAELEGKTGAAFTVTGELLKVDGFMRNLYVINGAAAAVDTTKGPDAP